MANYWTPPAGGQDITIRPLKGMQRNAPPEALEDTRCWTAQNLIATPEGLRRRPGLDAYMANSSVTASHTPLYGIAPLWKTDGIQSALLLSAKYPYAFTAYAEPDDQIWKYSTGTVYCHTSTVVVGSGTAWATQASLILPGDYLVLSATQTLKISTIDSNGQITCTSAASSNWTTGTTYQINRAFTITNDTLIDYAVIPAATNKVVIADGARPLYSWNGTTFTNFAASLLSNGSGGEVVIPRCVHYFGGSGSDRCWIANIKEGTWGSEVYYKQRLRWSSPTDPTDFTSTDYLDLPYSSSEIKRISNIGNVMLLFFEDAIFYGRATNDPDLPYAFNQLGVEGIGLVGSRAVTSYLGGLFFVSADNVYFIGSDLNPTPIGDVVVETTVKACEYPELIYATVDPKNDRVVFGFPEDSEEIAKIWSYNYRSKEWSYDDVSCSFLANPLLDLGLTWNDLTSTGILGTGNGDWAGLDNVFDSWASMDSGTDTNKLLLGTNLGKVFAYSDERSDDASSGNPPTVVFESKAYDLGVANIDKTFSKITVKLKARPSSALSFVIHTSVDTGNTWRSKGTLSIASDKREAHKTIKTTGSSVKVRLTSTSDVTPYTISEVVLRVIPRGSEKTYD
uniref:Uncharacterized protein n=1 Tax=viral metagenome TaxID=1070528 RepID=A0A6M3K3U2_9ZZZZ